MTYVIIISITEDYNTINRLNYLARNLFIYSERNIIRHPEVLITISRTRTETTRNVQINSDDRGKFPKRERYYDFGIEKTKSKNVRVLFFTPIARFTIYNNRPLLSRSQWKRFPRKRLFR